MLRPILYYTLMSPPSRSTLLAASAIGLDLDLRKVNLLNLEHYEPEFLKMNPNHSVPTLDDDGFILWDSHAINAYLVSKYAKNDCLYPKDLQLRAKVDQCLYFDTGRLFNALSVIFIKPVLFKGGNDFAKSELYLLSEAYKSLNDMLQDKKWLVGDSYTLADISNICTVTTVKFFKPLDKYPNITAWIKRCEEQLPGYAKWQKSGLEEIKNTFLKKISKL